MDEFLSLTELGKLYGVSSHVVGRWLKGLGLRTESGQPIAQAFNEKYVSQRPSSQPNTYFYVWHEAKNNRTARRHVLSAGRHDAQQRSIGQELLDADGQVIAWTTNPWWPR